ncbi:N-acetyltransferase family protein [Lysobacter xanthus]
MPEPAITLRPATRDDADAILALVPRLAATGTPRLRDRTQVEAADLASVAAALRDESGTCAVIVAEVDDDLAGFIHVRQVRDYYTQSDIAHVSDVVVARFAEGRGIGRLLMAQAEQWARSRGHRLVQLYVLPENGPARGLYETLGYVPEWLKYVKPLD